MRRALAAIPLTLAFLPLSSTSAAPPPALVLFDGTPRPGIAVAALAPDSVHPLQGERVDADAGIRAKFPNGAIALARSDGPGGAPALTLRWKDIWKSGILLQGAPQDLRPYLARGTLAFDLKVDALAQGGIMFKVGCGEGCERHVSHVVPGRAAEGQGWRRVVLSMSCFARDGDDFKAVRRPFLLEGTGSGEVAIANVVFSQGGTPNTPCPDWRTVAVTPDMLNESWSISWWLPRHRQKLEDAKRMVAAGRGPQLVFIGDSITEGWGKDGAAVWQQYYARHDAMEFGFGGDRTENVLWRLEHGALDGLAPKVAVLMVGTNNTGRRSDFPAITAAGIARNIDEIKQRLPHTRILLLAIFPRDAAPDGPLRRINDAINARLPALADGRQVFFLDVNRALLRPDGTLSEDIMPDLLHPNAAGYAIWARAMQPELERLMALPPL
ncbi:GDSL-type esterase/lipase family protein [Telluria beijingensis]|uniref:GDSL-type esterase/lipase family protein n=1 Tax=Telluria beijingensis TaxID=3068633 RepID=UPI00279571C7|nr:GDSL-type esterase/lipase family protein [Massilia sp. REN29]